MLNIFQLVTDALAIEEDIQKKSYLKGLRDGLKLVEDAGIEVPQNIKDDIAQLVDDVQSDKLQSALTAMAKLFADLWALRK